MKAIVHRRYGSPDVLELADIDRPVIDDDRVLVRVRAAAANALDWHVMRGHPYFIRLTDGLRRPKAVVAGVDVAGVVEAVGRNVTAFRPGDEVLGQAPGAFAEYVSAHETRLVPKPAGLTFEQGAAVAVAGCTALQALRDKGRIRLGQTVLVNGAAGGVGTFAVQLAKALGGDVTAVCSTRAVDLARSLGADRVIDSTREDFTRTGDRYDLILDIAANRSLSDCRRVLAPDGTFVVVGAPEGRWIAPLARIAAAAVRSRLGSQRMLPFLATVTKEDLMVLTELIEAGKVTPVIDHAFPLAETAAAIRHLEDGHPLGKIAIVVSGASTPAS